MDHCFLIEGLDYPHLPKRVGFNIRGFWTGLQNYKVTMYKYLIFLSLPLFAFGFFVLSPLLASEYPTPPTVPVKSSPQPARISRNTRNLMGFSRSLREDIPAPGMLLSFYSTTAVYKRGNRTEIRIHNYIDIEEDHSVDTPE